MCFFFNDTATTEIYTLSQHDALPIFERHEPARAVEVHRRALVRGGDAHARAELDGGRGPQRPDQVEQQHARSEEHTSELQSRQYLVCRLLLEKKKHNHSPSPCHLRYI